MATPFLLREAARVLHAGGLVAYPTEAVYGLGCDPRNPNAVMRLLALKRRPWQKGVILIAADSAQLAPYITQLDSEERERLAQSWPGPNTWIVPASRDCPAWIRGEHSGVAVRVTAHPLAAALCRAFGGAIVSTSANHAGQPPARKPLTVRRHFANNIDLCLHGPLGGSERPTGIRDLLTGELLRAG